MNRLLLIFLLVGLIAKNAPAQTLKGQVLDTGNKPVAFVTVSLMRDSLYASSVVTNDSGFFQMAFTGEAGKHYILQLTRVGYKALSQAFIYPDTKSLEKIILEQEQHSLREVTVTSKKPLVTQRSDRYVVNVEDSYLASGNTGLEVLQRSPGLWVSPDGSIRITGSQSVTVMINDVVQRMSGAELADLLRSIRSEDISRIEVIPNPPAEFEAASSGGIVHIILKRSARAGLTGTVSMQYRQQRTKPFTGAGASFDYKSGKWYVFGGYNFSIDRSIYTAWNNVAYDDNTSLYNATVRNNDNTRGQYRAGLAYDVSKKQSFNFQVIGSGTEMDQYFYSRLDYTFINDKLIGNALSHWVRHPKQTSATFNYRWKLDTIGSSLRMIADYTNSKKSEVNEVNSTYDDVVRNQNYRTQTPSNTDIYSLQFDYSKVLAKKINLNAGVKAVRTTRDNTVLTERNKQNTWTKDVAASNDFRYTEDLWMFYGTAEKTIGATNIKAGLRGEQTVAEGYSITIDQSIRRQYFSLFPSLFINQTTNATKGNSMAASYTRRIRRPGYNDLNPYRLQVHDFTVITGNPNLLPQYTHTVQASYSLVRRHKATIYWQSTEQYIAQTASLVDSNIIEYRSKNYPGNKEYGFITEASFDIGKIWNLRTSLLGYHVTMDLDSMIFKRSSFSIQTIHTINLKKIAMIDITAYYNSPLQGANTKFGYVFGTDIGITRRIWKERGRVRFTVNDVFNTVRETEFSKLSGSTIDFYQKRPTRTFGLYFSYTFRTGKLFTQKRIDQNNSEEKSRL